MGSGDRGQGRGGEWGGESRGVGGMRGSEEKRGKRREDRMAGEWAD